MQVVSYGLQFIIINDYRGNYLPVFGVSVSQLFYQFGMTVNEQSGNTNVQLSSSYFNAVEGSWEPILELLDVELLHKQEGSKDNKDIQLTVSEDMNINVTQSLLQTIRDTTQTIKTQREHNKGEKQAHEFMDKAGQRGTNVIETSSVS